LKFGWCVGEIEYFDCCECVHARLFQYIATT
jgi:hypothetical protein